MGMHSREFKNLEYACNIRANSYDMYHTLLIIFTCFVIFFYDIKIIFKHVFLFFIKYKYTMTP